MTSAYEMAEQVLLQPNDINSQVLSKMLGALQAPSIDYADAYFQYSVHESWMLDEGTVKSGNYAIEQGVGMRANSGEKTGFAYSDSLSAEAILEAARAARSIAGHGQDGSMSVGFTQSKKQSDLYLPNAPRASLDDAQKVKLLRDTEQVARQIDSRVIQVTVSLASVYDIILVARLDGVIAADVRPLVRMNVSVIVQQGDKREQGSAGGGGRHDYQYFLENDCYADYAREAVRQALVNLDASELKAGEMTVVLGSGWPGILLHEAVGHGLEGDFNRKGSSVFSGRIGDKVASALCTVVDDGTLSHRRGSLNIDDEGEQTQNTVLIENGILKGYMQDQLNARLMKMAPTGNGRRESYAHLPMPRMTNTYMLAGQHTQQEIIESVDSGLYAVNFGGGQVDITSGKFVFTVTEAYMIENGKISYPVKGATLIGNGPDVLHRVSMLGDDMQLDSGVGVCGKEGQSVPVGVGQPSMRIDGITVGGTAV